jgi:hypothetical protein
MRSVQLSLLVDSDLRYPSRNATTRTLLSFLPAVAVGGPHRYYVACVWTLLSVRSRFPWYSTSTERTVPPRMLTAPPCHGNAEHSDAALADVAFNSCGNLGRHLPQCFHCCVIVVIIDHVSEANHALDTVQSNLGRAVELAGRADRDGQLCGLHKLQSVQAP